MEIGANRSVPFEWKCERCDGTIKGTTWRPVDEAVDHVKNRHNRKHHPELLTGALRREWRHEQGLPEEISVKPAPRPCTRSSFIVMGERGQYSDWMTWPVAVYLNEADAVAHAERCRDYLQKIFTDPENVKRTPTTDGPRWIYLEWCAPPEHLSRPDLDANGLTFERTDSPLSSWNTRGEFPEITWSVHEVDFLAGEFRSVKPGEAGPPDAS